MEIYKALLINIIYIYNIIIKVKELKALYKELSLDIKFIITLRYILRKITMVTNLVADFIRG